MGQGMGPKCKQMLHVVQLSGVLKKHGPGRCFMMSLGSWEKTAPSERTLSELPNTDNDFSLNSFLNQKSGPTVRTFPTERRGVSLSEHSRDRDRVGPSLPYCCKETCPQMMSTSSRWQCEWENHSQMRSKNKAPRS